MPNGTAPLPELGQLGRDIETEWPDLPVSFYLASVGGQRQCFVALAGMRANRGGVLSWVARTMVYAAGVTQQEVTELGAYLVRWRGIGLMPKLEIMESIGAFSENSWIVAYSLDVLATQTPPADLEPTPLEPAQTYETNIDVELV